MQLLVINPNTSAEVTLALQQQVQAQLETLAGGRPFTLQAATARLGARYIANETSYAVAAHAALDAYALHEQQHGAPDAVLLGCFGDPGVWALRELSGRPVIGLAEAALREAAAQGPFAIVTGGAAWGPMLQRLASTLDLPAPLLQVQTVAPSGGALAQQRQTAMALLREACETAAADPQVASLVLGGAALGGWADDLADGLRLPLIDSVAAGARALWTLAANPSSPAAAPAVQSADWQSIEPALAQCLRRRAAP
jgi:Asp/Glu/hydantoin racemase